jgi:hypothetical protein
MKQIADEPPPFLRSWSRIYSAVVVYLIAIILLFYWFTQTFNR